MDIKIVIAKDLNKVQKISRRTFHETFSSNNTKYNMKKYSVEAFSMEQLQSELENKDSKFYFSIKKKEVVGYLKINFGRSQTELQDEDAVEIERIYVLKEHQGKGIGQLLYNKVIETAKLKNLRYIWLGVWEKNQSAIQFYKKNGFIEFDKHVFHLGDDPQTDIMMKLYLKS